MSLSDEAQATDPMRVRAGYLGNLTKLHKKARELLQEPCDQDKINQLLVKLDSTHSLYQQSQSTCLNVYPQRSSELMETHTKYTEQHQNLIKDLSTHLCEPQYVTQQESQHGGRDVSNESQTIVKLRQAKSRQLSETASRVSSTKSQKLIEAKVQQELQKLKIEQLKKTEELRQRRHRLEYEIELAETTNKLEQYNAEVAVRQKEEIREELGSDYESDEEVTSLRKTLQATVEQVQQTQVSQADFLSFCQAPVTDMTTQSSSHLLSLKAQTRDYTDAKALQKPARDGQSRMDPRISTSGVIQSSISELGIGRARVSQEFQVQDDSVQSARRKCAIQDDVINQSGMNPNVAPFIPSARQVDSNAERTSYRNSVRFNTQPAYAVSQPSMSHPEYLQHPYGIHVSTQNAPPAVTPTDMLSQALMDMHLPRPELIIFDGNPKNYQTFITSFTTNIASKIQDPVTKLTYLIQYCNGEAKQLIKDCVLLPPQVGYETAMHKLRQRFGKNYLIARAYIDEIVKGQAVKPNDVNALVKLSDEMDACQIVLSQLNFTSDLDSSETIRKLVKRLPYYIQAKWVDKATEILENGREPTFSDLARFVEAKARAANTMYGRDLASAGKKYQDNQTMNAKPKSNIFKVSTMATNAKFDERSKFKMPANVKESKPTGGSRLRCQYCETAGHSIETCWKFKKLNLDDRLKVAKQNKLCFRCLTIGHISKDCNKTCKKCNRRHHELLHDPTRDEANNSSVPSIAKSRETTQSQDVVATATQKSKSAAALSILPVQVRGKNSSIRTYALIDSGSNTTLIKRELFDRLGLEGCPSHYSMKTVTGRTTLNEQLSCELRVSSNDGMEELTMDALTVPEIPIMTDFIQNDQSQWPHLRDISLPQSERAQVELLIGTDCPEMFWSLEERRGGKKEPMARRTLLGWIILGPTGQANNHDTQVNFTKTDLLQEQLEKLWTIDFTDTNGDEPSMSIDDKRALQTMEDSTTVIDGKYHVAIPWKTDPKKLLPDNRPLAEARMRFLKKKLQADKTLHEQYTNTVEGYIKDGHAKAVNPDEAQERQWFLPHHAVFKKSNPNKCRVVFDCAAKFKGVSLNDVMLQGPNFLNNLAGVLTRFRQEPVAVVGDIKAMFHQCFVTPQDQRFLRFLWWPEGNLNETPIVHAMLVHIFGAKSSPSVAGYCIRKTANDNEQNFSEEAIRTLKESFYVDDMLKSVPDARTAVTLVEEMKQLLAKGGFKLTKFMSTHREVINKIPEEERAESLKTINIEDCTLPQEAALGLQWNIEKDVFTYSIKLPEKPATRRGLLATTASLYDPLGLVAPVILVPKLIQQELCRQQLDWDDHIPRDIEKDITQWKQSTVKLSHLQIPRCFQSGPSKNCKRELHVFSDASETAYGAAAYLKVTKGDEVTVSLIMGKSRVAPLKTISIPRLELTAATVAAKLHKFLRDEMRLDGVESYLWTDSMTVLRYIKSQSARFKVFVAHRIQQIQELTDVNNWNYVPSLQNPADLASRSIKMDYDKLDYWLKGPNFLRLKTSYEKLFEEPSDAKVDMEVKQVFATERIPDLNIFIESFSSYDRLSKATGWLTKYIQFACKKEVDKKLKIDEIDNAREMLIKFVQQQVFEKEIKAVTKGCKLPNNSKIRQLCPILSNGILRVGGRLHKASDDIERHPILLPRHHLTDLIIRDAHIKNGHVGFNHTLSLVRRKYYITKGYSQVKRVIKDCTVCRRQQGQPIQQKMADLPKERISTGDPPFTNVGVDYFGPMNVKFRRGSTKRYGCIFTCLVTRAVHIEIAHSLDSDSFLMALHRFIARRGKPLKMWSDNGTNFVAAEKELADMVKSINNKKVDDEMLLEAIEWTFNPPHAPHMGGVWERLIKSVKTILKSLVQDRLLTDEELSSFMCEVEKILNDRPLTHVRDDINGELPLTPNHLLLLRENSCKTTATTDNYIRRRWKVVQEIANTFYKRFINEYLPQLQVRTKWFDKKNSLKQNDVVLVADEDTPRGQWPLGVIEEVELSSDGLVRSVKVRSKNTIKRRPVNKLVLLERCD